jgi:hypothetical protein
MSRATERHQSWLDVFADYPAPANLAFEEVRRNISSVDECLQDLWNLGENIFLAWTSRGEPRPEEYIGGLISGSKHLAADELQGVADKLGVAPQSVKLAFRPDDVGVARSWLAGRAASHSGPDQRRDALGSVAEAPAPLPGSANLALALMGKEKEPSR